MGEILNRSGPEEKSCWQEGFLALYWRSDNHSQGEESRIGGLFCHIGARWGVVFRSAATRAAFLIDTEESGHEA
jgi:hypothetical protein